MKANRRLLILAVAALAPLVLSFIAAAIVSPYHSLTVDILGSYFPAWMVCILSGLTLTLIAHWIIQVRNLKPYVSPAPLIYSCLMIIFTFATWILFYQN
jgi:YtcA family